LWLWLLHSHKAEDQQQVVLHHITNNPELIKVSTKTLGTKGFLEGDIANIVSVPKRPEDSVAKSEAHEILNHLLSKIVINPVKLLLGEKLLEMIAQSAALAESLPNGF
jgi:hypothetical protein